MSTFNYIELIKYWDRLIKLADLIMSENMDLKKADTPQNNLIILFRKQVLNSISLSRIIPFSSQFNTTYPYCDISTIYSLVRNILENYLVTYYLYEGEISDDEKKARNLIWIAHEPRERLLFAQDVLSHDIESDIRDEYVKMMNEAESCVLEFDRMIEENAWFQSVWKVNNTKKQIEKQLKSGLIMTQREICKRAKIKDSIYTRLYDLTSGAVHVKRLIVSQISDNDFSKQQEILIEILFPTSGFISLSIYNYINSMKIDLVIDEKLNQIMNEICEGIQFN